MRLTTGERLLPWKHRMLVGIGVLAALATACGRSVEEAMEGSTEIETSVCDPASGEFTIEITNPYLPFAPGQIAILQSQGSRSEKVAITVLEETVDVAGVTTRVVEEREWVNDELVEVSRNFVAQAADGSVCYFGEEVDDYRNGEVVGHAGAWLAGENGAQPGILMPGDPQVGIFHRQEMAPGVAEDGAVIVAMGKPYTTPGGTFDDTVETEDVDPLSGAVDPKRYAAGVGLIVDETLELTSFTP